MLLGICNEELIKIITIKFWTQKPLLFLSLSFSTKKKRNGKRTQKKWGGRPQRPTYNPQWPAQQPPLLRLLRTEAEEKGAGGSCCVHVPLLPAPFPLSTPHPQLTLASLSPLSSSLAAAALRLQSPPASLKFFCISEFSYRKLSGRKFGSSPPSVR